MPFSAALVLGGANIVGGVMAGDAAKSAANTSAQAQLEAARIAADAARFRPIGTTTRFGSSQFGFDPTGQLTSAGYTVSPELQQYQDQSISGSVTSPIATTNTTGLNGSTAVRPFTRCGWWVI